MRTIAFRSAAGPRFGIVDETGVFDAGTDLFRLSRGESLGPIEGLELLAPVDRPSKVIGVGRNYAEHAVETGSPVPTQPQLFGMWANAIVGPGVGVRYPSITDQLDYEAELVVVIGRRAQAVSEARALDYVFGYTCGNDISARDLQFGETQWIRGKTLDTFAPIGPWIVTADEISDPQSLGIRCIVNGETRQDDTTANMIFSVAELIAFVSASITLEPGDVIFTGTPSGVAFGMPEPRYLAVGDRMRVEIDGIGALDNPVVAG